jgi:DNA polymerase-1
VREKLVILLDGDIFAYKAACVNQEDIDLGDGIKNSKTDARQAERDVESLIDGIMITLADASPKAAVDLHVCLTGPLQEISGRNFRKELYADYKGNRDPDRKPILLPRVKEHIREMYSTKIKDGIEADDVLGILMTHPTLMPGKKVCVSTDKDLLQIPGRHFNPDKDVKRMVTEAQGDYWFMYQTLVGDQVDNYPGCRGIGPVKAEKILNGKPTVALMWPEVVDAFVKKGGTPDDALVQARCARMLRHTDYNFKAKEPILWTPPH